MNYASFYFCTYNVIAHTSITKYKRKINQFKLDFLLYDLYVSMVFLVFKLNATMLNSIGDDSSLGVVIQ